VAVVAAFAPSWAERRDAKGAAGRAASLVVLLLVCIGVLAGAELLLARGFLVDLLYGGEYASSAPILAVLALSVPIFYADIALVWIAYVRGHEKRVAALGIVALVTNIAINVVLIRSFSGLGAAPTAVVTEATINRVRLTLGLHRKTPRASARGSSYRGGLRRGAGRTRDALRHRRGPLGSPAWRSPCSVPRCCCSSIVGRSVT
jgi:O-antigen/teichoic acid export membrane protein